MPVLSRGTNRIFCQSQITPTGKLRVNWNHPITNGLIGCYVPGVMLNYDLTGLAPTLGIGTGTKLGDSGPDGLGITNATSNAGMATDATAPFLTWTNFSIFYHAIKHANQSTDVVFAGVSYTSTDTNPFLVASISAANGTQAYANWNSGGTFHNTGNINNPIGNLTMAATFVVGGNTTLYVNGAAGTPAAFGAAAPTSTATSKLEVNYHFPVNTRQTNSTCYIASFWNRAITAAEIVFLHSNPFCFLLTPRVNGMNVLKKPPTIFKGWHVHYDERFQTNIIGY